MVYHLMEIDKNIYFYMRVPSISRQINNSRCESQELQQRLDPH
jgi:hypothetical protein